MTVTWEDNSDKEEGFKVERAVNGTSFFEIGTVPANVTSYVDENVPLGAICWYRVRAFKATETSPYSNLAGVETPSSAPGNAFALSSPPAGSKLINLSARAIPGSGDQSLIVGFVIQHGNRPILLRAIGPGLGAFTAADIMQDPLVTVRNGSSVIGQNDNWGGSDVLTSAFSRLGAFAIPAGSRDAALLADFAPNGYTVLVTGEATGLAIAEIYDADTSIALPGRLMNLSARAQIGTGDGVLIVGFVIKGDTSLRVLVRAIGPTLALYGVSNPLANPHVELYRGSLLLDGNDGWNGNPALASAFKSVGAYDLPDATSRDAALTAFLPPGAYTAIVSGLGGQTGVALAEIYELP